MPKMRYFLPSKLKLVEKWRSRPLNPPPLTGSVLASSIVFEYQRMMVLSPFQNCVEQPFDDANMFVSKNSMLAEEFALNIREYLATIETRIGNYNLHIYIG